MVSYAAIILSSRLLHTSIRLHYMVNKGETFENGCNYIYIDADLLTGWLAMHVVPAVGSYAKIHA
jgi:hypothetical protein